MPSEPQRRVYVLPADLVERIRAYQTARGIASETEAARRLLSIALLAQDTAENISRRLRDHYARYRDLRRSAQEVLVEHPLVAAIDISDAELRFQTRGGGSGGINAKGEIIAQEAQEEANAG